MYFRRQETLEQDIRNAYVTLKNFMQNREQVRIMDVVVVIVNGFDGRCSFRYV